MDIPLLLNDVDLKWTNLKVAFQGSRVTSDSGLILVRELDEHLGFGEIIAQHLTDSRRGKNTQPAEICYAWLTMSAINGDKARFHRERKHNVAKRERNRALREKLTASTPRRPDGRDL